MASGLAISVLPGRQLPDQFNRKSKPSVNGGLRLYYAAGPQRRDGLRGHCRAGGCGRAAQAVKLLRMRLALYQPDIPQNAATIVRMAACLGVPVAFIGPAGFDTSDRGFRRAGMDYVARGEITLHASFAAFEEARRMEGRRLILLTTRGGMPYTCFPFSPDDVLMLGRESAGVPEAVHDAVDARLVIPMRPGLRSLNVAVAAAMVLGEALRQTDGFPPAEKHNDERRP
jgi:tRNA (cytidine/uridine-2'-O-)-methyltransferase